MGQLRFQQNTTSSTRLPDSSTQKITGQRNMADHGVKCYFIGPAKHHYRNYNVYIPVTRGMRTTDTIKFFSQHVQMPKTSSEDRLAQATENLVEILQKSHPPTPFRDQGTKTNDAIKELQKFFKPRQQPNETTQRNRSATRVQGTSYKGVGCSYKGATTNHR